MFPPNVDNHCNPIYYSSDLGGLSLFFISAWIHILNAIHNVQAPPPPPPYSGRYGGSVGPREFLHPSCPHVDSRLT